VETVIDKLIEKYSKTIVKRPITSFIVIIALTVFLASGATKVDTVEQTTSDFLPDSFSSIQAFNTIQAEFGSAEATRYTILLESDPASSSSNEIRDMRDPRVLRYIQLIESETRSLDRVTGVESPANLFDDIPSSQKKVEESLNQLGEQRAGRYISDDYSAARIEVTATGLSADEQKQLAKDIRYNIESNPRPAGLELTYTGQTYIDEAFQNQSNRTNQLTSLVAFALVIIVVVLLFRSVFYGFTSLQTLVFGIAAGFGAFGHLGFNLSPSTSGAISIGIGIAIDFGIQPVARYREERDSLGIEQALEKTIKGVSRPMTLGVIAALLGFSSLSFGRLTFLSTLGTMLSLTTFMAYIAAFTVVPATLIIHDRYISDKTANLRNYFQKVKQK